MSPFDVFCSKYRWLARPQSASPVCGIIMTGQGMQYYGRRLKMVSVPGYPEERWTLPKKIPGTRNKKLCRQTLIILLLSFFLFIYFASFSFFLFFTEVDGSLTKEQGSELYFQFFFFLPLRNKKQDFVSSSKQSKQKQLLNSPVC